MITFEEASKLPRSEKITLVTMLAEKPSKIFEVYDEDNGIYSKKVDYFVESVKELGFNLEKVNSISEIITNETFYFSPDEMVVYVRSAGGLDPKLSTISIVYRFHFSTAPVILPYDLNNGTPVEWLPYISAVGQIGQRLDDNLVGVVLESSSSVKLINTSGFFDSIFDTMLWENKEVSFYSWIANTQISEIKKIFSGIVESKEFDSDGVNFKVKDFIFRLKESLKLETFSEMDGSVLDSYIGAAKRRIYGKVDKCQTIGLDAVKDGFELTGLVSASPETDVIAGIGTIFLAELSPNDEIVFDVNGEKIKFTIDQVISDTFAKVSKNPEIEIVESPAIISPEIPYRLKNRKWHIAGHKLRQSQQAITSVVSSRQFIVDDTSEFFAGDTVVINSVTTQITRISGNNIILEQVISPSPLVGDFIKKEPVLLARFGNERMLLNRDFTITNTFEAILNISELAEFNISKERRSSITFRFENGSRLITTEAVVDLRTILNPRDWIRRLTQSEDEWFEILSVSEQSLEIRTPFTQSTAEPEIARIKNVEIIDDDSLITVDCYGIDYENKWARTASNAARHLIKYDAGFSNIDEESFYQSNLDGSHTLSMVIPEIGEKQPLIRDVLNMINDSVFGSLYINSDQNICYSVVNSRRPDSLQSIKDDDIISWSCESDNSIVNKVILRYAPYVDTITGESATNVEIFDSKFVDYYSGIKNTEESTSYIYDRSSAVIIAQRRAFYKSTSSLIVTLKAKALFFNYAVNDRIYIELDRLFKRYGSSSSKKIGIVSGVKKTSTDSELTLNDMGNIFNRCPTIAPSSTPSFLSASEDDKVKYGFILGETLTPDVTSEEELGNCLIG